MAATAAEKLRDKLTKLFAMLGSNKTPPSVRSSGARSTSCL